MLQPKLMEHFQMQLEFHYMFQFLLLYIHLNYIQIDMYFQLQYQTQLNTHFDNYKKILLLVYCLSQLLLNQPISSINFTPIGGCGCCCLGSTSDALNESYPYDCSFNILYKPIIYFFSYSVIKNFFIHPFFTTKWWCITTNSRCFKCCKSINWWFLRSNRFSVYTCILSSYGTIRYFCEVGTLA